MTCLSRAQISPRHVSSPASSRRIVDFTQTEGPTGPLLAVLDRRDIVHGTTRRLLGPPSKTTSPSIHPFSRSDPARRKRVLRVPFASGREHYGARLVSRPSRRYTTGGLRDANTRPVALHHQSRSIAQESSVPRRRSPRPGRCHVEPRHVEEPTARPTSNDSRLTIDDRGPRRHHGGSRSKDDRRQLAHTSVSATDRKSSPRCCLGRLNPKCAARASARRRLTRRPPPDGTRGRRSRCRATGPSPDSLRKARNRNVRPLGRRPAIGAVPQPRRPPTPFGALGGPRRCVASHIAPVRPRRWNTRDPAVVRRQLRPGDA